VLLFTRVILNLFAHYAYLLVYGVNNVRLNFPNKLCNISIRITIQCYTLTFVILLCLIELFKTE